MVTCPNCRTEAEAGARYCGTCGCKLEEAPPCRPAQGQQYAPPAERPQQYPSQAPREPPPQYQQPQPDRPPEPPRYPQPQQYGPYQQYPPYPSYHYGPMKSAGVAAVLALVLGLFGIMGIGHLYVGRLTRGFIILAVGLALIAVIVITGVLGAGAPILWAITLIAGIALVLLWVWQTYDAYRLANEYNFAVQRSGRPAW